MYKKVVAIILIQRDNKSHFSQKGELILLHYSQCLPEIISFQIMVYYIETLHVNVDKKIQSLLYICLVLSGCIEYNIKVRFGN